MSVDNEKELQNGKITLLEDSEKNEDDTQAKHKDTGWAWVIMMGYFTNLFIWIGINKSFGLFFVEFLREYNTSSSVLSVMIAVQNLVTCTACLFILNFCAKRYQSRPIVCAGGILQCLAYVLNAFVDNAAGLIVFQGIVFGLGTAMSSPLTNVELNRYFDKKLGFASMISALGSSTGSLVFPIIIRTLLDNYGLQGALLIVGGINLNNVVIGALLRPFPKQSKKVKCNEKTDIPGENVALKSDISKSENNLDNYYSKNYYHIGKDNTLESNAFLLKQKRKRSLSENNCLSENNYVRESLGRNYALHPKPLSKSVEIYTHFGSTSIICSTYDLNIPQVNETDEKDISTISSFCSMLFDFSLLKNRHLLIIFCACFLSVSGCGLIVMYIPHFAEDNGVPNDKVAILVTIMGACDFCARFSLAFIIDRVRVSYVIAFCLVATGITAMFNPLFTSFNSFIALCVLYGMFGSFYFNGIPILLRKCFGVEKYPAVLSLLIIVHGIGFMSITPILGYIRDVTGSYTVSFYIMGVGLLIGCVIFLFEPIIQRSIERRPEIANAVL